MTRTVHRLRLFLVLFCLVVAVDLSAQRASYLRDNVVPKLREAARLHRKTVLSGVPLGGATLRNLEVEPMQVWADDARVVVYGADGRETVLRPPDTRYFRGRVVGEEDSAVFFSVAANGSVAGLVLIGERRWHIGTGVRKPVRSVGKVRDDGAPVLISEVDEIDDLTDPRASWTCQVASHTGGSGMLSSLQARAGGSPKPDAGNVAGATYQLRIAVETDNELCAAFGNDEPTITAYIGNLIGAASTVYFRDLQTSLVLGQVNVRNGGSGTDPWTVVPASGTGEALAEFGTYWHNNYSSGYPDLDGGGPATAGGGSVVPRSSAVFISGRLFSGGIAWSNNQLCASNFFCGTGGDSCGGSTYANKYGGAYAFNGSAGSVTTTIPDPEATINGVQYGLPNTGNFWMLLEVMHELGHNADGPHSHCVALTAEEKTLYSTSRNFVDECFNGEGGSCFSGTQTAPPEKGTIMSYCHNIFSGGFRQSRYLFGKSGEPSFKLLGLFDAALEAATPNPAITAQTEPVACSSGRTASVASCSGCTYSWQITGGSITSSTTSTSITYTPSAANVTLTVTVISSRGCGITASKTVASACGAFSPPATVTATAVSPTSVSVTWSAVGGATNYRVHRASSQGSYTTEFDAGSSLNFTDTTALANTSYQYVVRAGDGTNFSTFSDDDVATTVIFTDSTLNTSVPVKRAHFDELLTAVNALRALTGSGSISFSAPAPGSGVTVRKAHIDDLRGGLTAPLAALGLSTSFVQAITAGVTVIDESHVTEIRQKVQ